MNRLTAPTAKDIAKKELRAKILEAAKQQDEKFKALVESGDHQKASRLISMAFLLFSVGQHYSEEAIEMLAKYGYVHKKLKTRVTNLINCFDLYNEEMSKLINSSGEYDKRQAYAQFSDDFDIFQETCDRFMNADVRIGRMDAINRDDLRSEAVYLCQVKDSLIAPVQCFKWNGEKWLEFVREPFPKWTETDQTITYVIDRVKTVEE